MVTDVAFKVIKEMNGLKYWYESTIDDAIQSVCHKHRLNLSEQERTEVKNKVKDALKYFL